MKIAIIEPHYDDAWINLGGYILKNPEIDFLIISLCTDKDNRKNGTKRLGRLLANVKTKPLKLNGVPWNLSEKITLNDVEKYFVSLNKRTCLNWKGLTCFDQVSSRINKEIVGYDTVLLPLGAIHPQHIITSRLQLDLPTKYYFEFPYAYSDTILQKVASASKQRIDISSVILKKVQMFRNIYSTQLSLLSIKSYIGMFEEILEEVIFDMPGKYSGAK